MQTGCLVEMDFVFPYFSHILHDEIGHLIIIFCFPSYLKMLTSSAVVGIVIGLCVALPLLILATSNVIIGLLATLTLCCIIVCVVAMIPIAGWKLGVRTLL